MRGSLERRATRVIAALSVFGLLEAPAGASEQELEDSTAVGSIDEIESPTERSYDPRPDEPSRFPEVRESARGLPAVLRDSKLVARYRTYYLRQDRTTADLREAWAMGGSIYYRSGWLRNALAVELEGFTSQPIYAPSDRDGTRLLNDPGSNGYAVLGVANGVLRTSGIELTGYRQYLELAFLNRQDSRMTPNTFEALKVSRKQGRLRFVGGYAWRFKRRDGDEFVSFAEHVGIGKDRGAGFASVLWYPTDASHVGVSGYVVPDVHASLYADAHYDRKSAGGFGIRLDAQGTYQQSVGADLLLGAPFRTWNVGGRATASWRSTLVQLAFSVTGDERRIENFYGSNPTYLGLMQRTFNQADEKAVLVALAHDFAAEGLRGLSAIASYAAGWNGVVAGRARDAQELNVTLDYRLREGLLAGFWLRVRGAWLREQGRAQDGSDFRVILRYDFPVL